MNPETELLIRVAQDFHQPENGAIVTLPFYYVIDARFNNTCWHMIACDSHPARLRRIFPEIEKRLPGAYLELKLLEFEIDFFGEETCSQTLLNPYES